mgnify:FL=1
MEAETRRTVDMRAGMRAGLGARERAGERGEGVRERGVGVRSIGVGREEGEEGRR